MCLLGWGVFARLGCVYCLLGWVCLLGWGVFARLGCVC